MKRLARWMIPVVAVALMSACASRAPSNQGAPVYGSSQGMPTYFGRVSGIESLDGGSGTEGTTGAVVGGVAGAVVGRQMADSSRGKNVGTVVGAVAGALIGNQIAKENSKDAARFRVTVSLDNGSVRKFEYRDLGDLRVGDRVRVEGDRVFRQ